MIIAPHFPSSEAVVCDCMTSDLSWVRHDLCGYDNSSDEKVRIVPCSVKMQFFQVMSQEVVRLFFTGTGLNRYSF